MTRSDMIRELGQVILEWLKGGGDLAGLLLSWLEVVTNTVPIG